MRTKEEILDDYSKEVGLINFKNAVKHVWLKQWNCAALIRLVEKAMEEYRLNHQVPSTEITKKELSVIECMKDDIRAMIGNSDTDETWLKNVEIIENMLIRVKPKIK